MPLLKTRKGRDRKREGGEHRKHQPRPRRAAGSPTASRRSSSLSEATVVYPGGQVALRAASRLAKSSAASSPSSSVRPAAASRP